MPFKLYSNKPTSAFTKPCLPLPSHTASFSRLSHSRATKDHVHTNLGVEYYAQRSAFPGSLLITEGAVIHPAAGIWPHAPYIYTDAQVNAWKQVHFPLVPKSSDL